MFPSPLLYFNENMIRLLPWDCYKDVREKHSFFSSQGQPSRHQMLKGFRSQNSWVSILALPLASCVALGKLLNFSVPHFSSCKMGLIIPLLHRIAVKIK